MAEPQTLFFFQAVEVLLHEPQIVEGAEVVGYYTNFLVRATELEAAAEILEGRVTDGQLVAAESVYEIKGDDVVVQVGGKGFFADDGEE